MVVIYMQPIELVFQYFFAVGAGVGAGLVCTIGLSILLFKVVKKKWL